MACLNLSNGNFATVQFSTADANTGNVTVDRTPTSIQVSHSSFSNPLFLNGRWESAVFNNGTFVALLHFFDTAPGSSQRTIHIVDFTVAGNTPGLVQVHDQGDKQDSVARPQLELSPVNPSLIFTWSSTGQPNEVQRLNISRSDNGDLVMAGPLTVTGLNGNIAASITATQLIIDHPNSGFSDQTVGPRPAGTCKVVNPNPSFCQRYPHSAHWYDSRKRSTANMSYTQE